MIRVFHQFLIGLNYCKLVCGSIYQKNFHFILQKIKNKFTPTFLPFVLCYIQGLDHLIAEEMEMI